MAFLQVNKLGSVDLSSAGLKLRRFAGREEISRLSEFRLELDFPLEDESKLEADAILGKPIVFSIREPDRVFSGIVSQFSLGLIDRDGHRSCFMHVVPEMWKLTEIIDSRKFSPSTVAKLVEKCFQEASLTAEIGDRTKPRNDMHPDRVNPVQYDESMMDFLTKLFDQEGIFYFFKDDFTLNDNVPQGRQIVVLGDRSDDYDTCDGSPLELAYQPTANVRLATAVYHWERKLRYRPASWTIQDYDYKKSRDFNMTIHDDTSQIYHKYKKRARFISKEFARHRLSTFAERDAVSREFVIGQSYCPTIYPGLRISLQDHPSQQERGNYVITAVEHWATELGDEGQGRGRGGEQVDCEYGNRFVCVRENRVVVRCPGGGVQEPAQCVTSVTQRNRDNSQDAALASALAKIANLESTVQSLQGSITTLNSRAVGEVATVVDDSGSTDDEGKIAVYRDENEIDHIYVRYTWDHDEGATWTKENRFVRVAQSLTGDGWGAKFLPRIGQEVVVLFVDGEVDNQDNVVIGALNNDQHVHRVPASAPQMQTVKVADPPTPWFPNRDSSDDAPAIADPTFKHYFADTGTTESIEVPHLSSDKVSGIRTRSYDSDNANDKYNELLFDDTRDHEKVYLHAARDLNIQVDNDMNIEIRGDKREIIRGNHYQIICVGNIDPAPDGDGASAGSGDAVVPSASTLSTTPTTRNGKTVQEHTYPPADSKFGSFGVHRSTVDGVIFDLDKVIGTKSVEFVKKEDDGDRVWLQKEETYFDSETRHKGYSKDIRVGNGDSYQDGDTESYQDGDSFSEQYGNVESRHFGNEAACQMGSKEGLFIGGFVIDVFLNGLTMNFNGSIFQVEMHAGAAEFAFSYSAIKMDVNYGMVVNVDKAVTIEWDNVNVFKYGTVIAKGDLGLTNDELHIIKAKLIVLKAETAIVLDAPLIVKKIGAVETNL